ncbi:hypothetical protein ACF0H5_007246 [Mactra antiquata]
MAKLWVCFIVICFGITGTIVVKAVDVNYQGCFKKDSLHSKSNKTLSVPSKYECNVHCSNNHYLAINLKECYCLDQLPKPEEGECQHDCEDVATLKCGGHDFSVYNVTATTTTTTTTTTQATTTTAQAETTIPSTATMGTNTSSVVILEATTTPTTTQPLNITYSDDVINDDEEQPSNIYIIIGVSSAAVFILVITTVICIVSRRRNSSKTNSESLNTPNNLNTRDNGNDEGEYVEVDEAECNATVTTSQSTSRVNAYGRLKEKKFKYDDPTYNHLGNNNMGGACAMTDSEYSHAGECGATMNNKTAAIDFDTYNHVTLNRGGGFEADDYMDSSKAKMTKNNTAAIDLDTYHHVPLNKGGVKLTKNKTAAIDLDTYHHVPLNKDGVKQTKNKMAAIDSDTYNHVHFNKEDGVKLTKNKMAAIDSDTYNSVDYKMSQPRLQKHIEAPHDTYDTLKHDNLKKTTRR